MSLPCILCLLGGASWSQELDTKLYQLASGRDPSAAARCVVRICLEDNLRKLLEPKEADDVVRRLREVAGSAVPNSGAALQAAATAIMELRGNRAWADKASVEVPAMLDSILAALPQQKALHSATDASLQLGIAVAAVFDRDDVPPLLTVDQLERAAKGLAALLGQQAIANAVGDPEQQARPRSNVAPTLQALYRLQHRARALDGVAASASHAAAGRVPGGVAVRLAAAVEAAGGLEALLCALQAGTDDGGCGTAAHCILKHISALNQREGSQSGALELVTRGFAAACSKATDGGALRHLARLICTAVGWPAEAAVRLVLVLAASGVPQCAPAVFVDAVLAEYGMQPANTKMLAGGDQARKAIGAVTWAVVGFERHLRERRNPLSPCHAAALMSIIARLAHGLGGIIADSDVGRGDGGGPHLVRKHAPVVLDLARRVVTGGVSHVAAQPRGRQPGGEEMGRYEDDRAVLDAAGGLFRIAVRGAASPSAGSAGSVDGNGMGAGGTSNGNGAGGNGVRLSTDWVEEDAGALAALCPSGSHAMVRLSCLGACLEELEAKAEAPSLLCWGEGDRENSALAALEPVLTETLAHPEELPLEVLPLLLRVAKHTITARPANDRRPSAASSSGSSGGSSSASPEETLEGSPRTRWRMAAVALQAALFAHTALAAVEPSRVASTADAAAAGARVVPPAEAARPCCDSGLKVLYGTVQAVMDGLGGVLKAPSAAVTAGVVAELFTAVWILGEALSRDDLSSAVRRGAAKAVCVASKAAAASARVDAAAATGGLPGTKRGAPAAFGAAGTGTSPLKRHAAGGAGQLPESAQVAAAAVAAPSAARSSDAAAAAGGLRDTVVSLLGVNREGMTARDLAAWLFDGSSDDEEGAAGGGAGAGTGAGAGRGVLEHQLLAALQGLADEGVVGFEDPDQMGPQGDAVRFFLCD